MGRVGEALWSGPVGLSDAEKPGNMLEEYRSIGFPLQNGQDIAKSMEVLEDSLHAFAPFLLPVVSSTVQVARSSPAEVFLPKL